MIFISVVEDDCIWVDYFEVYSVYVWYYGYDYGSCYNCLVSNIDLYYGVVTEDRFSWIHRFQFLKSITYQSIYNKEMNQEKYYLFLFF